MRTLHIFMTLHVLNSLNSFALLHILMTFQYIMTLHILMTFFALNHALLLLLKPFFFNPQLSIECFPIFQLPQFFFLFRICRILTKIIEGNPLIFPIYSIKPN